MGFLARTFGLETLSDAAGEGGGSSSRITLPRRSNVGGVTSERMMGVPAALRAIELLSGLGSQLAIQSWRHGQATAKNHPLCVKPDPWRTCASWIERNIINLACDGNAFWRRHRDANGAVVSLEVLDPGKVRVWWDTSGGRSEKRYDVTDRQGRTVTLTAADIRHIWWLETPGLDRSLSPVGWCRVAAGGILDVREYSDTIFRNPDVPSGVLTTDQKLDPTSAKAYKDRWLGRDEDEIDLGPSVRVLGQGLTYSSVTLSPKDAQWLESQNAGVLDICRMFGLPPAYLYAELGGSNLTYANIQQVDAQLYRATLFPRYLRKIEEAISEELPGGQIAKFDASEFLRPDPKTRAEVDAIYLTHKVITPEAVATREGWEAPVPTDQEVPSV